jgi:hypothetical protein
MVLVDNGLLSSRWIRVNEMEKRKEVYDKSTSYLFNIF